MEKLMSIVHFLICLLIIGMFSVRIFWLCRAIAAKDWGRVKAECFNLFFMLLCLLLFYLADMLSQISL